MNSLSRRGMIAAAAGFCLSGCASTGTPDAGLPGDAGLELEVRGTSGRSVVLLHGLGIGLKTWSDVMGPLSSSSRVMAYNRPGYGHSRWQDHIRNGHDILEEMLRATQAAHLTAPYVVVGHSLGGLYAQVIAGLAPEQIAGMVLVDPVVSGQSALFKQMEPDQAATVAIARLTMSKAARSEFDESERMEAEVRSLPAYRGPSIILRALNLAPPVKKDYAAARRGLMANLAHTLNSEIVDAPTGHFIQNERPDLVTDAINRVLAGNVHPERNDFR